MAQNDVRILIVHVHVMYGNAEIDKIHCFHPRNCLIISKLKRG
jgi:hypothetical protein